MAKGLDTPAAVRRAAMDLLARREHGRAELSGKLQRRGAGQALIEAELDRLAAQGLLDESRYLQAYIASRARAGFGPLRIAEELTGRGVSRDAANQALALAELDWPALLRQVWRRKFAGPPEDAAQLGRQGRFLCYRGFPMEQVSRLLRGPHPE